MKKDDKNRKDETIKVLSAKAMAQASSPKIVIREIRKYWERNWWLLGITFILTVAPFFLELHLAIKLVFSLAAFISGTYSLTKRTERIVRING